MGDDEALRLVKGAGISGIVPGGPRWTTGELSARDNGRMLKQ